MAKKLIITKLDAAHRQIETAINLYFCEGDQISIHTLTAAAYGVLRGVSKHLGSSGMLIKDIFLDMVKPELKSKMGDKINEAENFFKHAYPNPTGTLTFSPGQSELLLLDACDKYRELSGEYPPLLKVFQHWYMLKHPDLFNLPPHLETLKNEFALKIEGYTRRQFFEEYLPVVSELG